MKKQKIRELVVSLTVEAEQTCKGVLGMCPPLWFQNPICLVVMVTASFLKDGLTDAGEFQIILTVHYFTMLLLTEFNSRKIFYMFMKLKI